MAEAATARNHPGTARGATHTQTQELQTRATSPPLLLSSLTSATASRQQSLNCVQTASQKQSPIGLKSPQNPAHWADAGSTKDAAATRRRRSAARAMVQKEQTTVESQVARRCILGTGGLGQLNIARLQSWPLATRPCVAVRGVWDALDGLRGWGLFFFAVLDPIESLSPSGERLATAASLPPAQKILVPIIQRAGWSARLWGGRGRTLGNCY